MIRQAGPVDYEIKLPRRRKETKVYYMNLLKHWRAWEALLITPLPAKPELLPQVPSSKAPATVLGGEGLSPAQRKQILPLIGDFFAVFSNRLGRTS